MAPTDDIASLEAAAKRGEADAVVALVLRYWDRNQPGDAEKAVAILKRSDDPRALYLLGQCYANGRGIQRDVEQAFNLFDRAARLGDLDAKHDLAVMIMNPPSGVEANPRYAASLFKEGAQAGNVNCMNSYARCLWEGAGVHKDQDEALKWFRKGSRKGTPRRRPMAGRTPIRPRPGLMEKQASGVPPVPWTIYGLGFKPCIAVVAGSVLDISSSRS